jgi:hypothetical protein
VKKIEKLSFWKLKGDLRSRNKKNGPAWLNLGK